jgi:hypothetical protein
MGKNKEEFMKDREKEINTMNKIIDRWAYWKGENTELAGELLETKHLLSQCKTLISDMVLNNLNRDMYSRYDDVMKQAQELLTELKDY